MKHKVSRNLFIGLGGTGSKILINVKKELVEFYGKVPPSIEFLIFDTDQSDPEIVAKTYQGKEVRFSGNEKFFIPITDVVGTSKSESVKKLAPQRCKGEIVESVDGANQVRSLGRFAFYENFSQIGIDKIINTKIERLKSNDCAAMTMTFQFLVKMQTRILWCTWFSHRVEEQVLALFLTWLCVLDIITHNYKFTLGMSCQTFTEIYHLLNTLTQIPMHPLWKLII